MNIQPPLSMAPRFPVTSLVAVLAITGSLMLWSGRDLSWMIGDADWIAARPWTLLTTVLLHGGMVHLVFNLMWWWQLAAPIEFIWGPARLLGAVALMSAVSSAAEIALWRGGIGLSGVVYGVFALLYCLQRRDPRFAGLVSRQRVITFAVWFVLCILMTAAGEWRIANIAHGVGALTGWLLGRCITAPAPRRALWAASVGALLAAALVGATVGRPIVNMAQRIEAWSPEQRAYAALKARRYDETIRLLEPVVKRRPDDAGSLVNLAAAYIALGRNPDGLRLLQHAVRTHPGLRPTLAPPISSILSEEASAADRAGNPDAAAELRAQSLEWSKP